ncbi:MAG: polysaccharide biosynthesis tyrosine autokinase [Anaerolineales bacterium]
MNDFIELRQIILTIFRRWWLVVLVTALTAALGYMFVQRQTPIYKATTTLLVGQIFQSTNLDRQDILTSEMVAQTYSDMIRRQPVLQATVDSLGINQTWQQLRKQVGVELVEGTQLIQIIVEANSPSTAQTIADEIATQMILFSPSGASSQENEDVRLFVQQQLENLQSRIETGQNKLASLESQMVTSDSSEQLSELQAQANTLESLITDWETNYSQLLGFLKSGQSPSSLSIIEPAQASPTPVRPRVRLLVPIAGGLGIFLALILIFLIEYLDDRIRSADEISQEFGLPILSTIQDFGRSKNNSPGIDILEQPRSPIAESFRMLRANLELIDAEQPLKTVLVTSCDNGVGKSMLSTNLAISMAQGDRETILVDADMRNSSVHMLMDLPNDLGLSDLLRNEKDISEALQWPNGQKSGVITGGAPPHDPSELLASKKMDQILKRLEEISDFIIIDAPPMYVSDAIVLSAKVDGVLLVVRPGHTHRKHIEATLKQLERSGTSVLGVILNRVTNKGIEYYNAHQYQDGRKARGRFSLTRNSWSGLFRKFGLGGRSVASNGKSNSSQTGDQHSALENNPDREKPDSLVKSNDVCPNEDCPDYGMVQSATQNNIIKAGKSSKGVQRYQCKTCGKTFSETAGTIFFRKHAPKQEILETLALIAEGNHPSDLSQNKGVGKDTIVQWLQEAAQHPEQVNDALIDEYEVEPDDLDTLWKNVRKKNGNSSPKQSDESYE